MAYSAEFRDHLLDFLAPLDAVARGMFGGLGLFRDGLMFGLVTDDRLYFRTDDENRPDYDAAGFGPFVFTARSGRSATMPYHEVPDDVLEDAEDLVEWGRRRGTRLCVPTVPSRRAPASPGAARRSANAP